MEIENQGGLTASPSHPLPRERTAQRLKYDAEIKVFKARFGDLEDVRRKLGFSRRQMCQLLLVDPSAWSRWHAPGGAAPPHVFRALEWFLLLEGKAELHPQIAKLYLGGTPASPDSGLSNEVGRLRAKVRRLEIWLALTPIGGLALLVAILIFGR